MGKVLKTIGKILLVIVILLGIFIGIVAAYDHSKKKEEDELLEDYPGEITEVDGHSMNVLAEGQGEHTLVFLAAAGDTAPALSFKPLYSSLKSKYRTVVIEKFGYGMSDVTDADRDYMTMVEECRTALDKNGIEAPYILCPYSKSGLDALLWAQTYPDEVEGIVGIDMAFPESYENTDTSTGGKWINDFARTTGLIRLFISDSDLPEYYSQEEKNMATALFCRNYSNKDMIGEMVKAPDAAKQINDGEKPTCPMYLFVTNGEGTGKTADEWHGYTEHYTEGMTGVTTLGFPCPHDELIRKYHEQLAAEIEGFIIEISE